MYVKLVAMTIPPHRKSNSSNAETLTPACVSSSMPNLVRKSVTVSFTSGSISSPVFHKNQYHVSKILRIISPLVAFVRMLWRFLSRQLLFSSLELHIRETGCLMNHEKPHKWKATVS